MRKKVGLILWFVLVLFVAGCSNTGDQVEEESQSTNEEERADEKQGQEDNQDLNGDQTDKNEQQGVQDKTEEQSTGSESPTTEPEVIEPQYELTSSWSLKPLTDDINEKVVLLTIDDAPDQHSIEMANTLKELDAKAIFFVNGHFLDTEEEQERLKQIHEMGFEIGNHTYNHQKLSDVGEDKQREEIISLNDLIEDIIGERPKFFRAPHGVNTDYAKQVVREEGMLLMNWTYGYDYFAPYMDAEKLATAMVTGEGPEVDVPYSLLDSGGNLLMHDREWTAEALPDIVKGLRDKGYEILDPQLIKLPE